MTDKYKALREAVQLATPGKWRAVDAEDSFGRSYDGDTVADLCAFIVAPERNGMLKHPRCDAAYIAAANPAAVLDLLAERDALLEALKRIVASDDAHATLHAPDDDDVARMIEYSEAFDAGRAAIAAATKGES